MSRCPRDQHPLASNDVNGYRYYSCEQCHGFWIPGSALQRVLSARGITELGSIPPAEKTDVQCPDCRTVCESLVIEACRLDRCPHCRGVWLDSGEVERVRRLFPENSAVVIADESRPTPEQQQALLGYAIADGIGNLLVQILG